MDQAKTLLPSAERGYLPYFILVVAVAGIGNAVQNFATLHYTRRLYNGKFVTNASLPKASASYSPADSVAKLRPTTRTDPAAQDQVTPLAARLFGTYTIVVGIIRLYAAYDLSNPALYQLALWTHVVAAAHFTAEMLVYKTMAFSGPQAFPFAAGFGGGLWMILQYGNYVGR